MQKQCPACSVASLLAHNSAYDVRSSDTCHPEGAFHGSFSSRYALFIPKTTGGMQVLTLYLGIMADLPHSYGLAMTCARRKARVSFQASTAASF